MSIPATIMAAYSLRFEMIWSILPAGKKDKEREKGIPNSSKEGMENP
jgi:hypothetical protein